MCRGLRQRCAQAVCDGRNELLEGLILGEVPSCYYVGNDDVDVVMAGYQLPDTYSVRCEAYLWSRLTCLMTLIASQPENQVHSKVSFAVTGQTSD